jgi:VNT family MFS transporter (synaptic vesicle glycoprotein 2)
LLYKRLVSAGHGKFHVLLGLGCGSCLVAMISEVFGISFLIPAAQCEFNMSSSEKGLLNAIGYIGERDLCHVNRHMSHRIDSLSGEHSTVL